MNTISNQFPAFPEPTVGTDTPLGAVLQATQVQVHAAAATAHTAAPVVEVAYGASVADDEANNAVVETVQHVAVDPTFAYTMDSEHHKGGQKIVINLFGTGCLECKHLVEDAEVDYRKCHWAKGNVHCPAGKLEINFVGAKVRWDTKAKKVLAMPAGAERKAALLSFMDEAREIEEDTLRNHVLGLIGF